MILFDALLAAVIFCQATWYGGPLFEGNTMRNGEVFRGSDASIVAVGVDEYGEPLVPLGTKLTICRADLSRCAEAMVSDTGLLPGGDLDASEMLFEKLAPLSVGRIKVVYYKR